jgi:hypothetical protein
MADSDVSLPRTILGVVGLVGYAATGVLYVGSGLVMPFPLAMWALWFVGIWPLALVFRRRRAWTPAVAVGAFVVWAAILSAGTWLFGWSA